jgi:pilus assembly protein Flp/PilA
VKICDEALLTCVWQEVVKIMTTFRIVQLTLAVRQWVERQRRREDGQGLVEYALILALIAVLVIVALRFLQPSISGTLNKVSTTL